MSCNQTPVCGNKTYSSASANYGSSFSSSSSSASQYQGAGQFASSGSSSGLSQLEQALLNAQRPLEINETEEITVNGQRGIFLNKQEVVNWRGSRPIDSYPINQDSNPQVIRKNGGNVEYVQQVNVRFLKPPSGQAGPIIIKQDPSSVVEPAPPVIIRQQGNKAQTPAPQVFREAPPKSINLAPKEITLKGKSLPPPPRRVIVEKLPSQPNKPSNICIDRWLAPENLKRKVIFKPAPGQQQQGAQKNVIIEWGPIQANVRQQVNVRGVVEQNPEAYLQQYGSQLVSAAQLPAFVRNVQAPSGARLAADAGAAGVELEGDLHALALVDLEAEGLGEYRQYLNGLGPRAATSVSAQAPSYRASTPVSYVPQAAGCGAPRTPVNDCSC